MRRALTRLPLPPPGELGQAKVTLSPWGELAGVTANWSQPERERERQDPGTEAQGSRDEWWFAGTHKRKPGRP